MRAVCGHLPSAQHSVTPLVSQSVDWCVCVKLRLLKVVNLFRVFVFVFVCVWDMGQRVPVLLIPTRHRRTAVEATLKHRKVSNENNNRNANKEESAFGDAIVVQRKQK